MPPDDSTTDVDFVAHGASDPGGFEELPQPPERPGLRRWRVPLTVAGVIVAAAVAVLAVVVQKASTTPTASPGSATPTSPAATPRLVILDPGTGRAVTDRSPLAVHFLHRLSPAEIALARIKCPRLAPTCVSTGESPAAVLHAVRSAFPHATHLIVLTDVAYQISSGRSLVYRQISARSGRLRIAVEIRAPEATDLSRQGISHHAGLADVFTETKAHGLTVDIEVTAPAATPPKLGAIARLAVDPRLRATG